MDCVKLLVALVVADCAWSLPLGCEENGTSYKEGEVVQAGGPCLSCVCRRGALACSLRVCADYVEGLPPGCFFVHKAEECCPEVLCEGGYSAQGIEVRTAVRLESEVKGKGCVVNGTVYGEGSAVANWEPCEYCYCSEGGVKCLRPRCVRSLEGCEAVYEKFSCCPTHFDCRDAKVGFFMSRIKDFAIDSEPDKEDFKGTQSGQTTTPSEEKTTQDFQPPTTEEFATEDTTSDAHPETTTPSPPDDLTTLGLQTIEAGESASSATGSAEETTAAVTAHALSETEDRGEEASGAGSGSSEDMDDAAATRWNSSDVAEDYDAYDYGEPKLPPSLPNLVIFPFVAADAVVKDDRLEPYEKVAVDRIDHQALNFKDQFSPPTRTEGGFVPKQPPPETFYEFPFLRKALTEPPAESAQMEASQEASSSFDGKQRPEVKFEDTVEARPFGEELESGMGEFHLKRDSESFRRSQQTQKPVTVEYKNVVVDFYPDHLVSTTRSQSATQSEAFLNSTDEAHPLQQRTTTIPAPVKVHSDPVFGFSDGETTSGPPTEEGPALTPRDSSFFDQFLKSLTESNTPTVMTLAASNRHKYSSKIKGHLSTTAKPKLDDDTESGRPKAATKTSFIDSRPSSTTAVTSQGPPTTTSLPPPQKRPHHLPTTPSPAAAEDLASPEPTNLRGHHSPQEPQHGSDRSPPKPHSNPGTLLKLAGCNIYGMMYRIGKVIAELSGPCVECLCTDLGVQCSPLEC